MAAPVKLMRSIPTTFNVTDVISTLPSANAVGITTAPLTVLGAYSSSNTESGSVVIAKLFTMIQIAVLSPARIRLYSTAAKRDADLGRPNTIPPTPGTQHGVLADLYLDTADKFSWLLSPPALCLNGDGPQATLIYYNVTNIGSSTQAISVTITYVPMES